MGTYYSELKSKWGDLVQKGEGGRNFDLNLLSPGKFCLHISDIGGSMSCGSDMEITGFFDDTMNALAYIRFVQIPRILDFDSVTNNQSTPKIADAYLLKYEDHDRAKIDHLLGLLDRALLTGAASPVELSKIRDEFNAAFSETNPQIEILAWGSLTETLTSDYFKEIFDEDIERETEEDKKPSTMLKELLDSYHFDEGNGKHLSQAKEFLEQHMSV